MNILQKLKWKSLKAKLVALYKLREQNAPTEINIKKEIGFHFDMAKFYTKHLFDEKVPYAEVFLMESYRAAAGLGDKRAQYLLSNFLFNKARFWQQLDQGIYANKVHQKYASDLFEEGFVYLKAAEEQGDPLAKRLHGLAYINGWGVAIDKDKGFQLVVDSIDQENGWAKATKIFEETGLNKPEFFSSIMSLKKNSNKINR